MCSWIWTAGLCDTNSNGDNPIFLEANTSICMMAVIHWKLIVKEPNRFKLKPYLQLDSRQQKPVKQKIIFQTM